MLTPTEPRTWLKKSDDRPQGHGKDPYKRTIEELLDTGVINLDKPPGPTSHEVVSWVKGILHIKRAGHSGTLDPHVTGCLPTMLGDATRLVRVLLLSGKEYVCVMRLHADVPEKDVRQVLEEFTGTIYQRPPLVSAVKRVVRKRTIYYTKFLELVGRDVLFIVGCEAGTYIRKLCHDIGEALGCGAHMYELRRTRSGPFTEDDSMITLHTLKDAYEIWKETGKKARCASASIPWSSRFATCLRSSSKTAPSTRWPVVRNSASRASASCSRGSRRATWSPYSPIWAKSSPSARRG